MTIAVAYLTSEGVVLGADSTSSMRVPRSAAEPGDLHHFNYSQKIFEVGPPGSHLGIVTWGLGSLGPTSYRTLIASLGDELLRDKVTSVAESAQRWATKYWNAYASWFADLPVIKALAAKPSRTPDEDKQVALVKQNLFAGFCLAGVDPSTRLPSAYLVQVEPLATSAAPVPQELPLGGMFWGTPNIIQRMLFGWDPNLGDMIIASGKWVGNVQELIAIFEQTKLGHPLELPLREAIDWTYSSIFATIKALKFSHAPPTCGGPIEVAVISTDRPFRWVRHKKFDSAIATSPQEAI